MNYFFIFKMKKIVILIVSLIAFNLIYSQQAKTTPSNTKTTQNSQNRKENPNEAQKQQRESLEQQRENREKLREEQRIKREEIIKANQEKKLIEEQMVQEKRAEFEKEREEKKIQLEKEKASRTEVKSENNEQHGIDELKSKKNSREKTQKAMDIINRLRLELKAEVDNEAKGLDWLLKLVEKESELKKVVESTQKRLEDYEKANAKDLPPRLKEGEKKELSQEEVKKIKQYEQGKAYIRANGVNRILDFLSLNTRNFNVDAVEELNKKMDEKNIPELFKLYFEILEKQKTNNNIYNKSIGQKVNENNIVIGSETSEERRNSTEEL